MPQSRIDWEQSQGTATAIDTTRGHSKKNFVNHTTVHVGKTKIAAAKTECQFLVVEPQEVQQGRM